jgi:Zn-dependent protease
VEQGYLVLGRWGGAPVRAHFTLPLGAFVFGGAEVVPGFWLGFFLIVLIHEVGHALVVLRSRCRVVSIDLHGLGGACRWQGGPSAIDRARIAWGGVWAQCLALLAAIGALSLFGEPASAFTGQLAHAFTAGNVWLMLLNLIPVPPLDGAEAWKLFPLLRRQRQARGQRRARAEAAGALADLQTRDHDEPAPEVKAAVDAWFERERGRK